jgi:diguanylate cyclase (GGDEF)-like protein/PAS domain S-box-containing protein
LPLGILSADARGVVVYANDAAQQVFGLSGAELLGQGYQLAVAAEDREEMARAAAEVITVGCEQEVTARVVTGRYHRWAHTKFVPLGQPSKPTGWLATVEDVTDRRAAESHLTHQATHDALTGLPNRLLLEDRLEQACSRLHRGRGSVSVLFIDLDRFKDVNDHHGHAFGDRVLAETARRLEHAMRDVDTLARLGGDEFVAVCESLDDAEADAVARRIMDAVAQPLMVDGVELRIGASVGVARSDAPGITAEELMGHADRDMYRVKRAQAR